MLSPGEIANKYSEVGKKKTELPFGKTLVLAILAGLFIAFGAFGSQVVSADASASGNVSQARLMSGIIFPVGLMMVLMAGAELFTGNNLIIISVLDKKATIKGLLRNWIIVYVGNMIGGMMLALILTYGHSYTVASGNLVSGVISTAANKCNLSFGDALLRGILCNILVCLAVWISFAAEEAAGKILGLFLPITLFVVSGFEHCVANMYFIPAGILAAKEYGMTAEGLTWYNCFFRNLLPVTLGNIIGGALVVGVGYYYVYLSKSKAN